MLIVLVSSNLHMLKMQQVIEVLGAGLTYRLVTLLIEVEDVAEVIPTTDDLTRCRGQQKHTAYRLMETNHLTWLYKGDVMFHC